MFIERPQWYSFSFDNPGLTPGFSALQQSVFIRNDAPFRLFGLAVYVQGGTFDAASVTLRIARPDGRTIQRSLYPVASMVPYSTGNAAGAAGQAGPFFLYFAPVMPNIVFPPNSIATLDVADLPGNVTGTVRVILVGAKAYRPGDAWSQGYPDRYTARPYQGYSVQVPVAQLPVLNVPMIVKRDADFVWQHGQSTLQPLTPPLAFIYGGVVAGGGI